MNNSDIGTLYKDYSAGLKSFIRSRINDADATHDVLQDVFVKAHVYRSKLKDQEKIKPWLYSIARNLVNDHFRKNKLKVRETAGDIADEMEPEANNEMSACIHPMINKLPPVYREALIEVELKGTDQKKLAEKLSISYSGAKSRVQRARELLKTRLMDCCKITADKYGNIVSHTPRTACSGC